MSNKSNYTVKASVNGIEVALGRSTMTIMSDGDATVTITGESCL